MILGYCLAKRTTSGFSAGASSKCRVMGPTLCLVWVNASCANLNEQPLLTLRSNVRSIPPLVKPYANMSRISTRCVLLMMPCDDLSRTEMRCNLKLNSCGSQTSIATTASHTARTSIATSDPNYKPPFRNKSTMSPKSCDVPRYN